jgi:hypothetical protein
MHAFRSHVCCFDYDFAVALTLFQSLLYACQAINSQPKGRLRSQKTIHCIYIAQRSVLTYIQESNKQTLLPDTHQRARALTDAPRPWHRAMCKGKWLLASSCCTWFGKICTRASIRTWGHFASKAPCRMKSSLRVSSNSASNQQTAGIRNRVLVFVLAFSFNHKMISFVLSCCKNCGFAGNGWISPLLLLTISSILATSCC